MASFKRVYTRKYHPDQALVLTWDVGFNHLEIYDNDRLINRWEYSKELLKGATIQDEVLGEIHINFAETQPIELELKVNGNSYVPLKNGKQVIDFTAVNAIFWIMLLGSVFASLYFIGILTESPFFELTPEILCYIIGVVSVYLFSALMMLFKKYWVFFVGYAYLILSTIWYTYVFTQLGFGFYSVVFLLVRFFMIFVLALSIRKVIFALRSNRTKNTIELIDDRI
ncbi:MAG: hypothetical protein Crog4KO_15180 [Crocinitomicaceae bacterium]